jgi:hypothetical protein
MKKHIVRLSMAWMTFVLFLVCTNPVKLPLFGLVVPFALLWWAIYQSTMVVQIVLNQQTPSLFHRRIRAHVVSFVGVAGLAFYSIGELKLRDFIILVLFASLAYFYFARTARDRLGAISQHEQ